LPLDINMPVAAPTDLPRYRCGKSLIRIFSIVGIAIVGIAIVGIVKVGIAILGIAKVSCR
jgi:hypothetical protein